MKKMMAKGETGHSAKAPKAEKGTSKPNHPGLKAAMKLPPMMKPKVKK